MDTYGYLGYLGYLIPINPGIEMISRRERIDPEIK
jgi:hypothetical protein